MGRFLQVPMGWNGQAHRQDLAAGGPKTRRGGAHLKNTVLDVCSNRGAKREMGGTDFKWGAGHYWPLRWRRPWEWDIKKCRMGNPVNLT